jgi:hypothetical protein
MTNFNYVESRQNDVKNQLIKYVATKKELHSINIRSRIELHFYKAAALQTLLHGIESLDN